MEMITYQVANNKLKNNSSMHMRQMLIEVLLHILPPIFWMCECLHHGSWTCRSCHGGHRGLHPTFNIFDFLSCMGLLSFENMLARKENNNMVYGSNGPMHAYIMKT